ncbi:TauD/TfdA family dioxygenase [Kitasatospora sp. NPDC004240]
MTTATSTTAATTTAPAAVESYGTGTGLLLTPAAARTLAELPPAYVTGLLAEAGFLLLRGFGPDLRSFSAFVKAHSRKVTLDPARSFHGGEVAQMVDAGTAAVGLHLENGNSPFGPDLTWFFCEKAAARGSQTTVCDGVRVWGSATDTDRAPFAQDIVYSRVVEEAKWRAFVHHHLGGDKPLEAITVDDITALANDPDSTTIDLNPDGSITYAYRTPAVHGGLFSDTPSWANSVFGPSYNYETPTITFADGTPLDPALLDRWRHLTETATEDLEWQDGDVALIDNTRVMHGRRAILDTERTIYNAQSYLSTELLPLP